MTFTLELETEFKVDFDALEVAKSVAECALDLLDCPYEAQVNLLITDNEEIRRINKEYRDIDRDTDVLSFPMIDYSEAGDFDCIDEDGDFFDPDSGELILGDIIICARKVFEQAEEYGHSVKREFAFLVAHSILHLTGFDHMNEDDSALMEEKQTAILDKLGIKRD